MPNATNATRYGGDGLGRGPLLAFGAGTSLPLVYSQALTFNVPAATEIEACETQAFQLSFNLTMPLAVRGTWLKLSLTSGTTPAQIRVAVDASGLNVVTHSATIIVSGSGTSVSALVTLTVTAPTPTISQVANAASYSNGTIAPGEIVIITGTAIGPVAAAQLSLDAAQAKLPIPPMPGLPGRQ